MKCFNRNNGNYDNAFFYLRELAITEKNLTSPQRYNLHKLNLCIIKYFMIISH